MKTVSIHQPEYFPWLGLIDKIRRSDVFVVLDDVQFKRDSLQQRAKLADGITSKTVWMSIPFVHRHPQMINEVLIDSDDWPQKHCDLLNKNYSWTSHFKMPPIKEWHSLNLIYPDRRLQYIVWKSMMWTLNEFGIQPESVASSMLNVEGVKSERILNICKNLGATHYLTGGGGASYLDAESFKSAGIEIVLQDFQMPSYRLGQPDPMDAGRGLSALDALMHLGTKAARELLTGGGK